MKKELPAFFFLSLLLLTFQTLAQNTGIGTATPENKLHVFKGSAGVVTGWADAPLIVENSANSYINLLAPNAAATGILFGKPENNISGGIFYNDISHNANGFDFRTNGNITQMVLNNSGDLGIGTLSPEARLHVYTGSAGSVSGYIYAPLIVESSTNNYINLLSPDDKETGMLFGMPAGNTSGGIIFNNSDNRQGFQFRTNNNITQMVLNDLGNLGIGTLTPGAKLHVFKGSAGNVSANIYSPLVVENSTHSYINLLAPEGYETGILFGRPTSNVSGGIIYNSNGNGNAFQFRTNHNVIRMVLSDAGNLGVGTADPGNFKLKVSYYNSGLLGAPVTNGLMLENTALNMNWSFNVQGNLVVSYNGVQKGSFITSSGEYFSVSDERMKTNIKPMESMLAKINQLKPATYQFKNTGDKQEYNGFIAQEVMKIFPGLVAHNEYQDVYTMNYSGFGVLAIKGIQELQPVVQEQNEKIASLEERIIYLEKMLAKMVSSK